MKFLIVVVALVGLCSANPVARTEVDVSNFQPLVCRNGTMGLPDSQKSRIASECVPKFGDEPGQHHPDCLYFCQSDIIGLLNLDGLPTRAIYDKFVQVNFPEQYRAKGLKWFGDCYEKYGQHVVKSDQDLTCKIAGEFNSCTWSIQPELVCTE